MAGVWIPGGLAVIVALAAFVQSRRNARQLAELTQMYWGLKFDHGELKAKVDPPEAKPPQVQQTFVPLSSVKKS
jgi:hypothetical protein